MVKKVAFDKSRPFRVALISMPWAIFNRPSIQLGALKAFLENQGLPVQVNCLHHYLDVAGDLGIDSYNWLALSGWAGEALYAPLFFPEMRPASLKLYNEEKNRFRGRKTSLVYEEGCSLVRDSLRDWLARVDWSSFNLVGFSVCFNQLLPSLVAARAIKDICPEVKVVFGGASCAGEIAGSLLENFERIDHVISGEGERPLADLVEMLMGQREEPGPQVFSRGGNNQASVHAKHVENLDTLPFPDYRDYFRELAGNYTGETFIPEMVVEFSRGCWWGKCAFCNLNLHWCGYRSKSAARMVREVRKLAGEGGSLDFSFTDNVLPVSEARRFFAVMASTPEDFSFFAEIRADQRRDLRDFHLGGLVTVQAGIEALSNGLLQRMKKGVSVIENLAVMKEALATGVVLEGNLITEFPGSTEVEVIETLECLDFALAFQPLSTAAFFLGHGSPVDRDPSSFSILSTTHHQRSRSLYPPKILESMKMLIKGYRGDRKKQHRIWRPVVSKVLEWQAFHLQRGCAANLKPPLAYRDGGSFLIIRQEVPGRSPLRHRLLGTSRKIYLACDRIIKIDELLKAFPDTTEKKLITFLENLVEKKIMFRDKDKFLALAIHQGHSNGN